MAKKTIKIQEFAPDMVDFDSPHMEVCENLVPVRGEYTPIFSGVDVGLWTDSNRAIAGTSHVVSQDLDIQTSRPEDDHDSYRWWLSTTKSQGEGADLINEVTPSDLEYVYRVKNGTTSPTFEEYRTKLSDLIDPTDDTNHVLSIRWRGWEAYGGTTTSNFIANIYHFNGASTWTRVETGGDLIDESIISPGVWQTTQATLTTADVTAALNAGGETDDYEKLYLVLEPTMSISGGTWVRNWDVNSDDLVDNADNWEITGGEVTLWQSVEYDASPDSTYITTPPMQEGESIKLRFPLEYDDSLHVDVTDYPTFNLRGKGSVDDEVLVHLDIYKDDELIYESNRDSPWDLNDTWTNLDWSIIDYSVFEDWDSWSGIELEFTIENTATGGASQSYDPDQSGFSNAWTNVGGVNHVVLSDGLETTYLESPTVNGYFEVTMETAEEPSNHENTKFKIKAKHSSASNSKLKVTLTDGTNSYVKRFSADQISSSGFAWLNWSLSKEQSGGLDWSQDFDITVRKEGGTGTCQVSECKLTTSSDNVVADISRIYMARDIDYGYEVSWAKFTIPAEEVDITGDAQRIYIGTQSNLYECDDLDSGQITDVTNGDLAASGLYGSDGAPKIWDFCSWGGNIIATNFIDPVQWMDIENGGEVFDNLIAEVDGSAVDLDANPEDAPRAKFVDVVQNSLVLANLNFSGHYSYSLCWCHINDPTKVSFPSYTYLSDSQILVQTPGEITGFVGGDYGTIFKRNSIYRMSYVGSPLMYRFDIIARGVGTSYPKSIVSADDDIYFFGDDAFYVMKNGGKPVPISEGKVSSMFTDVKKELYLADGTSLNARAYYPHEYDKQYKIDNSLYGVYDRTDAIIYWFYTCEGDTGQWKKTKAVAYNIKTGQWGFADMQDVYTYEDNDDDFSRFRHVSVPIGLLNTRTNLNDTYGGVVLASKHDISGENSLWRPISKYTRPAKLETALFSSRALGGQDGDSVKVKRVRPVFHNNDEQSDSIRGMTVTLQASDDPYFNDITSSQSVYGSNTDNGGWFDLAPISGEYFRVRLQIPSWAHYNYEGSEFSGPVSGVTAIQFDVEYAGEY